MINPATEPEWRTGNSKMDAKMLIDASLYFVCIAITDETDDDYGMSMSSSAPDQDQAATMIGSLLELYARRFGVEDAVDLCDAAISHLR